MSGMASATDSTGSDDTQWSSPVLGDAYRCSRSTKNLFLENLKKSPNLPKSPRPGCTVQVFEAVKRGIRSCIQSAEEDILRLRISESPASFLSAAQHIKLAERFKQRLESHFVKIERLEESYVLNLQLWEGAKTMAKAYISYGGRRSSPQSIDCGLKECLQTLCAIEASLEALLGTFDCTLKGLFGSEKLSPGDAFEVTLRYGQQKWKSRGKIGVTNQSWDPCVRKLRVNISNHFSIKTTEVKLLGKQMALGETKCETISLFSAKSCDMSVNLNTSGSLQLGILVKWNPLEGADESEAPPPVASVRVRSAPGRRQLPVRSMIEGDGQLELWSMMSNAESSSRSDDRRTNRYSVPCFQSMHGLLGDANLPSGESVLSPVSSELSKNGVRLRQRRRPNFNDSSLQKMQRYSSGALDNIAECLSPRTKDPEEFLNSREVKLKPGDAEKTMCGNFGASFSDVVKTLKSKIEQLDGKYSELKDLEKEVNSIEDFLRKNERQSFEMKPSDVSDVSIENVLESFSFLDSEDCVSEPRKQRQNQPGSQYSSLAEHCDQSPESTVKTTDSGIESIVNHLEEDEARFDSLVKTENVSARSWCVDEALKWHMRYCTSLLSRTCKGTSVEDEEAICRDKLRRQTVILSTLTSIATNADQEQDIHRVLNGLTTENELQQFWLQCIDSHVFFTSTDYFFKQLYSLESDIMAEYMVSPKLVFDTVLSHVLDFDVLNDAAPFESDIVTVHQFMDFFTQRRSQSVLSYVLEVAAEAQRKNIELSEVN